MRDTYKLYIFCYPWSKRAVNTALWVFERKNDVVSAVDYTQGLASEFRCAHNYDYHARHERACDDYVNVISMRYRTVYIRRQTQQYRPQVRFGPFANNCALPLMMMSAMRRVCRKTGHGKLYRCRRGLL